MCIRDSPVTEQEHPTGAARPAQVHPRRTDGGGHFQDRGRRSQWRLGRCHEPMISPVVGSTTPRSAAAGRASRRCAPLPADPLTAVETGYAANLPARSKRSIRSTAAGSVRAGSSQAAQLSGSRTSGWRSWIRSRPGSAAVVRMVNVVSQASGSSPVSYTHLDVYKRQQRAWPQGPRIADPPNWSRADRAHGARWSSSPLGLDVGTDVAALGGILGQQIAQLPAPAV